MVRPLLTATAALLLWGASAQAAPERYQIDPSHFSIVFSADHIGYGPAFGMFLKGGGSFIFDEETQELSDLVVTIDADSVFSNDDRRDGHLRSDEFLAAEANPEIRFEMTEASAETDTTGTISGDLTLRGETKPVTLDVTLNKIDAYPFGENYVIGVTATTTLKRSEWGMNYAVENGLVGDEVDITLGVEAIRQDD